MAKKLTLVKPPEKDNDMTRFGARALKSKTMTLPYGSKVYVSPEKDPSTGDMGFQIYAVTPDGQQVHHTFLRNETLKAIGHLRDCWMSEGNPEPREHSYDEIKDKI
jgi:hypothetical protein